MLLCLECFKVYNQKTIKNNICKVKECYGDVVEIDELFVPVIAELNRKGYKTQYCCSSHFDSNSHNAYHSYIYFDDEYKFPCLPNGYKFDQDWYPDLDWEGNGRYKRDNMSCRFDGSKSLNELSKDIFNNAISVLEWVDGLEDLNKGLEDEKY